MVIWSLLFKFCQYYYQISMNIGKYSDNNTHESLWTIFSSISFLYYLSSCITVEDSTFLTSCNWPTGKWFKTFWGFVHNTKFLWFHKQMWCTNTHYSLQTIFNWISFWLPFGSCIKAEDTYLATNNWQSGPCFTAFLSFFHNTKYLWM